MDAFGIMGIVLRGIVLLLFALLVWWVFLQPLFGGRSGARGSERARRARARLGVWIERLCVLLPGWVQRRETVLVQRLAKKPQPSTLREVLSFTARRGRPFPIDHPTTRAALARIRWSAAWSQLDREHRVLLLEATDQHLRERPEAATTADWAVWLEISRRAGCTIKVTDPDVARRVLDASARGWLDGLPAAEARYLLACYLRDEKLSEKLDPAAVGAALPVFAEVAARAGERRDESLLRSLERHLLQPPHESTAAEWRVWLTVSRVGGRVVDLATPEAAAALLAAKRQGWLDGLSAAEVRYLLSCYLRNPGLLARLAPEDVDAALPVCIEAAAGSDRVSADGDGLLQALERHLFGRSQAPTTPGWQVWLAISEAVGHIPVPTEPRVAGRLRDAQERGELRGLRTHHIRHLLRGYMRAYGFGEEAEVADAGAVVHLFVRAAAALAGKPAGAEFLFEELDRHLLEGPQAPEADEWKAWLALSRIAGRALDVTDPRLASGLLTAKRRDRLHDLPDADARYLLLFYLQAYETLLESVEPGEVERALPLLVEYAALSRSLGQGRSASAVLRRCLVASGPHPRPLDRLSDEQALDTPLRGVGSANGIGLTLYHRDSPIRPVQIACAGTTSDPTLNARVFSSLFAVGLACSDDTPVLTTVGGLLRLGEASAPDEDRDLGLLRVALGLTGAAEPRAGMATAAMDASEAFDLIGGLFQELQGSTGLAAVVRWNVADAEALDTRVRKALLDRGTGVRRMRSAPGHSEGAGVIHVLPLLHRTESGQVEPTRIAIPSCAIGADGGLALVHAARHAYLSQLIAFGRRRQTVALDAYRTHDRLVQHWENLDFDGRALEIAAQPNAEILYSYDFELGITIRLREPKIIPRAEYEEVVRPDLRDAARQYAERFEALCSRLMDLDRLGGPADRLSFTVLMDALLRRSPPRVADARFQHDFEQWADEASPLVWALVEEWAARHGYPSELLAADNILFRSWLSDDGETVWVEPYVAVDLHDHEIFIDQAAGLVHFFSGKENPSLRECLVARSDLGITDPAGLHEHFCSWMRDRLEVDALRTRAVADVFERVMDDRLTSAVVLLELGRRQLLRGEFDAAVESFDRARGADLAPVYFWAALAHQARLLKRSPRYARIGGEAGWQRPLSDAFDGLLMSLRPVPDPATAQAAAVETRGTAFWHAELLQRLLDAPVLQKELLDRETQRFLEQLLAKDPAFVAGLLDEQPNLAALTTTSLNLTRAERDRVGAAICALSAVDFLALAEEMKDLARALPVTGRWSNQLAHDLVRMAGRTRTMPFADPPAAQQIEELAGLLKQP